MSTHEPPPAQTGAQMTTATVEGVRWTPGIGSAVERVGRRDLHRHLPDRRAVDCRNLGRLRPEVDAAVRAARQAFPGWAAMPRTSVPSPSQGRRWNRRPRRGLARVETRDNGSLLRSHRRSVMPRVG